MQRVDETHVIFNIDNAASINHIVVFLTGVECFPNGMGGAIYLSWPSPDDAVVWMFLGYITNEKPSAIFKVVGLKKGEFSCIQNTHQSRIGQSALPTLTTIDSMVMHLLKLKQNT